MKLSQEDFDYVLMRIGKDAQSPTGQALTMMMMHGAIMAEAIRRTGTPAVRLAPVYKHALQIANAMHLTEDELPEGVTVEQAAAVGRAIRRKENPFTPSDREYEAISLLRKAPEGLLKSMARGPDELPGISSEVLWGLQRAGHVTQEHVGDGTFRWKVTQSGTELLLNRRAQQ